MRVASKVGNLPSKFGHARSLGSRIIRYVRDGQTDGRTDKRNAYCPVPHGRRHNNVNARCTGNDGHNVSHSNYYIWPFGLSADISLQKYVFG